MVGPDAEHSGIIRAGAKFVEAMATATVPKIVLTVNHASGAGYYAMAGQGFDPDFIFSWPTGRMGVMEGDSAVQAVFGSQLEKLKKNGQSPDDGANSRDGQGARDVRYGARCEVRCGAWFCRCSNPTRVNASRPRACASHCSKLSRPSPRAVCIALRSCLGYHCSQYAKQIHTLFEW